MYLLWKPCKMLGIFNLTYSRQFKQNIKYKIYKQWGTRFLHGKPPQTMTYQSKSTIQNQVTHIYLAVLY